MWTSPVRFAVAPAVFAAAALAASGLAWSGEHQRATNLIKTELSGLPDKEANVLILEVAPGWTIDRHIHPGHIFVYVEDGAIEVSVEGQEPQTVAAGEAFHELPDRPMTARNLSSSEGARLVIFQVGEQGAPLTVMR